MSDIVTVTATIWARPGLEDQLLAAISHLVGQSVVEGGVLSYRANQGRDDTLVFHLQEQFESEAAFRAHVDRAHVVDFFKVSAPLLARPSEIVFWTPMQFGA